MIEIKNLTKIYPQNTVYENFNVSFKKGEITCLLGESGCGKTTLLNVLANLTEYSGQVPKLNVSYIFQKPNLLPNLTVYQNLQIVNNDRVKIESLLKSCGLTEKSAAYPNELSSGQAQRVSIARAFLYPSNVILMDDPFASLDLKLKLSMAKTFVETQRKEGRTAIFVTHDIDEALMLSNRIIVLKKGKISADIQPQNQTLPREYGSCEDLRKTIIAALLQ